ncbi:methyltransferase family protein [Salinarchaeum sp. Harcht-Bsk1]|uniref:small ribosomal subunit Rsm22 family protein n=1 Tax=Salinarchaeum sp. Harcht-Bsk1 TaxID=1333523 RepID=UPI00034243CF|nr:methyltransferase [Salinarchaeum sp. Harcht-Bsk1]AGN02450.1 methyltransferase family protein [Salinarchaeum sp. Harcht-Bsk1]
MPDREAIRSNAKYLRNVRPLDPEEISEYVEGGPHPAVVRQVLREESFDLGIVEREDGTFVPVEEGTIDPPRLPVTEFPESYATRLEELLVDAFGQDWHLGESGNDLRDAIRDLKEAYHRGWSVTYDDETAALAYALYHLPDYYAAVQYPVAELAEIGLLDRQLRILEVGAGTGGPALGIADAVPDDALVRYDAIEPSASADVFEAMVEDAGDHVDFEVHRTTAEDFAFDAAGEPGTPEYDLVLFANVLSELDDPVATAKRYTDLVADDGAMVLLSPADRRTTGVLRGVERALADGTKPQGIGDVSDLPSGDERATVFSPTVRLWPNWTPADEGWSFAVRPDIDVPAFQRRLDEPAGAEGEFVNVDVQYAYATLRWDGERRVAFRPDRGDWAPLAESEKHVSDRVDCAAIKLSADLSEGGHPLFRIGDGSQQVDHFAVLTKETSLNRSLATAGYGDLLTLESVLVLWNDDEQAYNFVVDDETIVESVAAPVR